MDFHQLVARLNEIDRPVAECGDAPQVPPAAPTVQPPTLNVNLNAQGIDNIEQMMQLFHKVNPDMKAPARSVAKVPLAGLPGELDSNVAIQPLTTLPLDVTAVPGTKQLEDESSTEIDLHDAEYILRKLDDGASVTELASKFPELSKMQEEISQEHDLDLVDDREEIEELLARNLRNLTNQKDRDTQKAESSFQSATTEPDEDYKSIDYMTNQLAGGMNKPKRTYPRVSPGDNPMQKVKEHSDLRAQIRAELTRRLAEAKGAR